MKLPTSSLDREKTLPFVGVGLAERKKFVNTFHIFVEAGAESKFNMLKAARVDWIEEGRDLGGI